MPILAQVQTRRTSAQVLQAPQTVRRKSGRAHKNEALATVAHDARNVLASLQLYCDLLAAPGVFAQGREHFAMELRAVAAAGTRLVERLTALRADAVSSGENLSADTPIRDLARAVREMAGPLAALAGASIDFEVECRNCPGSVLLTQEELTRILINFTRNAAEAMPQGGRIRVTLQQGDGGSFFEGETASGHSRTALLCVQDSGPGIPESIRARVFDPGFSTKRRKGMHRSLDRVLDRGLGLSIVRDLVVSAGGSVRCAAAPGGGARFEVELPLIGSTDANQSFLADFPKEEFVQC
jgi:signal transduction histidine kinase